VELTRGPQIFVSRGEMVRAAIAVAEFTRRLPSARVAVVAHADHATQSDQPAA
jgi:hypothetical protein